MGRASAAGARPPLAARRYLELCLGRRMGRGSDGSPNRERDDCRHHETLEEGWLLHGGQRALTLFQNCVRTDENGFSRKTKTRIHCDATRGKRFAPVKIR